MDSDEERVVVQNGAESSLLVEVKEKQDQDPSLFQLEGDVHKQKVPVLQKGEMAC